MDLEGFYAAMADMSSAIRGGVGGYPATTMWASGQWSIGKFTIDSEAQSQTSGANMSVTVSAVRHDDGCEATNIHLTSDGQLNFNVTATGTRSGCVYNRIISCVSFSPKIICLSPFTFYALD